MFTFTGVFSKTFNLYELVELNSLLELAKARVTRNLTESERRANGL
jgi:hypothetical protein